MRFQLGFSFGSQHVNWRFNSQYYPYLPISVAVVTPPEPEPEPEPTPTPTPTVTTLGGNPSKTIYTGPWRPPAVKKLSRREKAKLKGVETKKRKIKRLPEAPSLFEVQAIQEVAERIKEAESRKLQEDSLQEIRIREEEARQEAIRIHKMLEAKKAKDSEEMALLLLIHNLS